MKLDIVLGVIVGAYLAGLLHAEERGRELADYLARRWERRSS